MAIQDLRTRFAQIKQPQVAAATLTTDDLQVSGDVNLTNLLPAGAIVVSATVDVSTAYVPPAATTATANVDLVDATGAVVTNLLTGVNLAVAALTPSASVPAKVSAAGLTVAVTPTYTGAVNPVGSAGQYTVLVEYIDPTVNTGLLLKTA